MVKQMDVAKRITQLRTDKNITVNKLANLAGLSQGFVRQVELGKQNPTIESLNLICEALDISLSDFFRETEAPDRHKLLNKLNENAAYLTNQEITALIRITDSMRRKTGRDKLP